LNDELCLQYVGNPDCIERLPLNLTFAFASANCWYPLVTSRAHALDLDPPACSLLRRIVQSATSTYGAQASGGWEDGGEEQSRARERNFGGGSQKDLERQRWLCAARVWREGVSRQMVS